MIRAISSKSSSRRVRRFENDNLFGLGLILGEKLDINGEDPGLIPKDVETSNFVVIMDAKNKDAMDFYLSCADRFNFRERKHTGKSKSIAHQVEICNP